jgi:hypothetical protein
MFKYKVALVAVICLTLNSCSTTYYSKRSIVVGRNDVSTNDVVVDVRCDMKKSVSATSSERETVDLAKSEAYYKAITANNIDMIIDPIYEVKTVSGKSIVKVTGFAGYYDNPRTKTEAIKELKSVESGDFITYQRMYYPDLVESKHRVSEKQIVTPSVKVLNSGMKFLKPSTNVKEVSSKMQLSAFNCQNVFSTDFGDNNGIAIAVAYDFNPNKKIGFNSEFQYAINSDFDHITKTLYLRYSLFPKLHFMAGPSILYFMENDGFNALNFGYTLGTAYNYGNRLSFKVKTSQFANVSSNSDFDISYTSLSFGVGYRF